MMQQAASAGRRIPPALAVPPFRWEARRARRRVTQPDVRADEVAIEVLSVYGLPPSE